MTIAIRYYSKFGHSAQMADVVSQVTGAKAETTAVPIDEPVDVLFLGKVSSDMVRFIRTLTPDKVGRVICFGSCALIKSPVTQMSELLEAQGITTDVRSFSCRGSMGPIHKGHPDKQDLEDLRQFIESTI